MRNTQRLILLALVSAGAACSSDSNDVTDAGSSSAAAVSLSTANNLGAHLVDKDGKTLYFYVKDIAASGVSACTGTCLTTWPAADLKSPTVVGDGLTASDFGTTTAGGQTTWKGRPLYTYSMEASATSATGEAKGGIWFVARPYNLFLAANGTKAPQGATATDAPFITNGAGLSLYIFKNDTRGTASTAPVNSCTSNTACSSKWPIWEKPAALDLTKIVLPSTIPATDVTTITVGAQVQFVYKGWPTYFFATDTKAGDIAGANVSLWYAVNPAFTGTLP